MNCSFANVYIFAFQIYPYYIDFTLNIRSIEICLSKLAVLNLTLSYLFSSFVVGFFG